MSCIYDDCADVCETRTRRARKAHKCCACDQRIPAGSQYQITSALYEGSWASWKRCDRCQAIYVHITDILTDAECAEALDCGHTYLDEHGKEPPLEIAALAFALPGEVGIK